jgi:methylenetetrahydrofolate dehydrogenase (NADP+) / methenyltetrahydrofolate cyclohydrolase
LSNMIDPSIVAQGYREKVKTAVSEVGAQLNLVGLVGTDYKPSLTYAKYTEVGCNAVGINFELRVVDKYDLESEIKKINEDNNVHGVMIYYPIFTVEQDNYLKDLVDFRKDIEGLNTHWIRKLYNDDRIDDKGNKAILPCTPLSIIKLLESAGAMNGKETPLKDKKITIFNRSEVVGRPLASMMAHDGATVYSFDLDGVMLIEKGRSKGTKITRQEALATSDIVITGVPSNNFELIRAEEIREETICVNFSTVKNFEKDAIEKAKFFIPRVGPMTVTMALRNTLRLYRNYHC